jgi:hypothetical protein
LFLVWEIPFSLFADFFSVFRSLNGITATAPSVTIHQTGDAQFSGLSLGQNARGQIMSNSSSPKQRSNASRTVSSSSTLHLNTAEAFLLNVEHLIHRFVPNLNKMIFDVYFKIEIIMHLCILMLIMQWRINSNCRPCLNRFTICGLHLYWHRGLY